MLMAFGCRDSGQEKLPAQRRANSTTSQPVSAGNPSEKRKAMAQQPDSTNKKFEQWKTDAAPLTKRFPVLGSFESCLWQGGYRDNTRGGLPAPSTLCIRGYVVLKPEVVRQLLDTYEWTVVRPKEFLPVQHPQAPAMQGRILKSEDLVKQFGTTSTFRLGMTWLAPDDNVLYLDLESR
jgi:hypothetical protein